LILSVAALLVLVVFLVHVFYKWQVVRYRRYLHPAGLFSPVGFWEEVAGSPYHHMGFDNFIGRYHLPLFGHLKGQSWWFAIVEAARKLAYATLICLDDDDVQLVGLIIVAVMDVVLVLVARPFRHRVQDCLEALAAVFRLTLISLLIAQNRESLSVQEAGEAMLITSVATVGVLALFAVLLLLFGLYKKFCANDARSATRLHPEVPPWSRPAHWTPYRDGMDERMEQAEVSLGYGTPPNRPSPITFNRVSARVSPPPHPLASPSSPIAIPYDDERDVPMRHAHRHRHHSHSRSGGTPATRLAAATLQGTQRPTPPTPRHALDARHHSPTPPPRRTGSPPIAVSPSTSPRRHYSPGRVVRGAMV